MHPKEIQERRLIQPNAVVSLYQLNESANQQDQVVILGLQEGEQDLPVLHLCKLKLIRTLAAQVFKDLVDVRDPGVVYLAHFLLDLLLEVCVVENSKWKTILLAQKSVVLVEAIKITVLELLNKDVTHHSLLEPPCLLSISIFTIRRTLKVCHLFPQLHKEIKVLILINLVVLLYEVSEVVLRVVVLLNELQEATRVRFFQSSHRELEHVLTALFVVDIHTIQQVLWQTGGAWWHEQDDSQNLQKFDAVLSKELEGLIQEVER